MRKRDMCPLPARVLVDLPNWLGDFVHTLPALAALVRANQQGETWALLPAPHACLAKLLGLRAIERPPGAAFRFGRGLRGCFDVVLTARHSTRAKLLLTGIAAPRALASRGRGAAALGLATFSVERSRHQRHDLDLALRALGLQAGCDEPFVLPLPAGLAARGRHERSRLTDGGPVAALLPATRGGNGKQYPVEHFARVAEALAGAGTATVVVVGPGEERLAARVAGAAATRVAPTHLALDETAALIGACDAAVGNDSGLTHLAAAVGCPTVALFGPTDPARTAPTGSAVIVRAAARGRRAPCVEHLDPGAVVAALRALLASRPEGRGAQPGNRPTCAATPAGREGKSSCAQREATL
jgi:ADP-heptose:LPS heptosyltransferase